MLTEIEQHLKRTMGLDAASIGLPAVERAVQERMAARSLRDEAAYGELLRASAAEMQALIEAVVVPETWFFRDREAFAALTGPVYGEWLRTHAEGVFRVLSLPCSTGEEPYSMAMAMLDAGVPANRFRVDAVDISARALAVAQAATYGRNSFRGDDLGFRDRHFDARDRHWALRPVVKRQVHFTPGNIFAPDFLPGAEVYDVIFCRNVLIYFDRPMQDQAVGVLQRLLTPAGCLFVGPSETGLLLSHDFEPARLPLAFAFRKGRVKPREVRTEPAGSRPLPARPAPAQRPPAPRPFARPTAAPAKPAAPRPATTTASDLDAVAALADQGRLVDAARRCEEILRRDGPSARAYYLLGLVRDAAGSATDAVGLYRKALYLEPRHPEALLHLAFLLEQQGDRAGAKVLTERARRIGQEAAT